MDPALIVVGLVGSILGFLGKTVIDFFVSANKDEFKDYKSFLSESIKGVEATADQINKDIFSFYTSAGLSGSERHAKILRIESDLKFLGVQVNALRVIIDSDTALPSNFENEVMEFRKTSTLDIHLAFEEKFDAIAKLQAVHVRFINIKKKLLTLKVAIATYKASGHLSNRYRRWWATLITKQNRGCRHG